MILPLRSVAARHRTVSFASEATTTFVSSHGSIREATATHRRGTRDGDGVVRALDDRLVIERLTVTDERAARVVRERAEGGQEAAGPWSTRSRSAPGCSTARMRRRRSTTCGGVRAPRGRAARSSFGAVPWRGRRDRATVRACLLRGGRARAHVRRIREGLAERIAQHFEADRDGRPAADRGAGLQPLEERLQALLRHFCRETAPTRSPTSRGRSSSRSRVHSSPPTRRRIAAARSATSEVVTERAHGREADARSGSPRPRRRAPARAAPSRSGSTARSSESPPAGATAHHTGDEQAEGGDEEGRHAGRVRRRRGAGRRPDRLRGQGQAALQERGVGRAQRGRWRSATPRFARARRGRRGASARGPRAACTSTRATS